MLPSKIFCNAPLQRSVLVDAALISVRQCESGGDTLLCIVSVQETVAQLGMLPPPITSAGPTTVPGELDLTQVGQTPRLLLSQKHILQCFTLVAALTTED